MSPSPPTGHPRLGGHRPGIDNAPRAHFGDDVPPPSEGQTFRYPFGRAVPLEQLRRIDTLGPKDSEAVAGAGSLSVGTVTLARGKVTLAGQSIVLGLSPDIEHGGDRSTADRQHVMSVRATAKVALTSTFYKRLSSRRTGSSLVR